MIETQELLLYIERKIEFGKTWAIQQEFKEMKEIVEAGAFDVEVI